MTEMEIAIINEYRKLTPEQQVTFRRNLKAILSSGELRCDPHLQDGEDPQ